MTRVFFVLTLFSLHLRCEIMWTRHQLDYALNGKGPVLPPALLEKTVCGQAESVIDITDHGERVRARDEVLLDDDCSFSTYACETAGPVLKDHVSGRDSCAQVHPAILDNCRKTIAVGSYVRNLTGHNHDVWVARVRHEVNPASTAERSKVSPVTR